MTDKTKCEWDRDNDGCYESTCENAFEFNDGTFEENGFKFCPYCGREIEVKE